MWNTESGSVSGSRRKRRSGAGVGPKHTDFLRDEHLHRLERQILADDLFIAKKVFVAQMRTLVVQLRAHAEAVATERDRQPDEVIRIDQIVGRSEIELGEDAPDDIQLEGLRRHQDLPRALRPKARPRPTKGIHVPSPVGSSSERNVPRRKL